MSTLASTLEASRPKWERYPSSMLRLRDSINLCQVIEEALEGSGLQRTEDHHHEVAEVLNAHAPRWARALWEWAEEPCHAPVLEAALPPAEHLLVTRQGPNSPPLAAAYRIGEALLITESAEGLRGLPTRDKGTHT